MVSVAGPTHAGVASQGTLGAVAHQVLCRHLQPRTNQSNYTSCLINENYNHIRTIESFFLSSTLFFQVPWPCVLPW